MKKFFKAHRLALGVVAAAVLAGCSSMPSEAELQAQFTKMMSESFRDQGIAKVDRIQQEPSQVACSTGTAPDPATTKLIETTALATIKPPSDGKYLGDWKEGEKLAQNGRGMTWTDRSTATSANGGNCYNCHQVSKAEISFGTIGPSLYNYGKLRGVSNPNDPASKAIVEYTWGKLYNAWGYNACSNMPRFGHQGLLDEGQMKHIMALLLDPASPVNQQTVSGRRGRPRHKRGRVQHGARIICSKRKSVMNISKREFMQVLSAASVAGMGLGKWAEADAATAQKGLYDLPRFGNVSFLHMTDCHAQLKPIYFREPSVNLGIGSMQGNLPHLVGEHLLKVMGARPGTDLAHAFTYMDFEKAARRYGKVGGFAHLATLVKMMKASRPGALLLDGGDTWQGSATALWSDAQDMVEACKALTVDVMTGHWEFTYGMERVKEIVEKDFKGKLDFVAQNVKTNDFGDQVFAPYVIREINGVSCAIIGQAFPYTPIANPRYMVADWGFGIQDENMQKMVDEARGKGAKVVVVISHNGMDVDLKMASRVRGIDAIFGGHTHDGVPVAIPVSNAGGKTLVTNAGSNGKFLGVMDFEVKDGKVVDFRYKLLPVFANQLKADPEMDALITKVRKPYEAKLAEKLAVTDGLLYRRGNFNGSWDQLICDAMMDVQGADLAFSPGFRWGTSLLPGDVITRELMMDQIAITYPYATLTEMTGAQIKTVLEDVGDNLFNPDPYYQQGGDMVRVGGLAYTCTPGEKMGSRISDMRLKGKVLEADKKYKVAGWAPVAEEAKTMPGVKPIWDVMETWFKSQGGRVKPRTINTPKLVGVQGNPGIAA